MAARKPAGAHGRTRACMRRSRRCAIPAAIDTHARDASRARSLRTSAARPVAGAAQAVPSSVAIAKARRAQRDGTEDANPGGARCTMHGGGVCRFSRQQDFPTWRHVHARPDSRFGDLPGYAFDSTGRGRLARRADRDARRAALERDLRARFGDRIRADRLGLRARARGHGIAVVSAARHQASDRAADRDRVRAARGGLRAGHADQGARRPSDARGRDGVGGRASARERHAACGAAVRRVLRMGVRRFHRVARATGATACAIRPARLRATASRLPWVFSCGRCSRSCCTDG